MASATWASNAWVWVVSFRRLPEVVQASTPWKERPILFKASMVRAILEGRKHQTRRVVSPQPSPSIALGAPWRDLWDWKDGTFTPRHPGTALLNHCPYGKPGDRLWVRETWARTWGTDDAPLGTVVYRADVPDFAEERNVRRLAKGLAAENLWKPSIHMPRWACRLVLEVTDVRVERLQDISEEDAKAEGCGDAWALENRVPPGRDGFRHLWESIHG